MHMKWTLSVVVLVGLPLACGPEEVDFAPASQTDDSLGEVISLEAGLQADDPEADAVEESLVTDAAEEEVGSEGSDAPDVSLETETETETELRQAQHRPRAIEAFFSDPYGGLDQAKRLENVVVSLI